MKPHLYRDYRKPRSDKGKVIGPRSERGARSVAYAKEIARTRKTK